MGKGLLQSLIKLARVTLGGKDDKEYPIQQVEYNGKTKNVFVLFPYGVHANLPEDCIVGLFPVDGSEQNKFGIGGLPSERIKNLPKGEVVFFHPLTKSKIHFKNSGDVDFTTEAKGINIKNGNGTIILQEDGTVVINGVSFDPSGNISGVNTLTDVDGVEHTKHKHSQPNDSSGDAQVDTNTPSN